MLFRNAPKYMLFAKLSCINKHQHFSPDLCFFAGFLLNAEHTKPPFVPREARVGPSPCLCVRGGAGRHRELSPSSSSLPAASGGTQEHLRLFCLELGARGEWRGRALSASIRKAPGSLRLILRWVEN